MINSFIVERYLRSQSLSERVDMLIKAGILKLTDGKFQRRNWQPRLQDELPKYWRYNVHDKCAERCSYCFDARSEQVDHLIPRSAWPEEYLWLADDGSNLVASCKECNQKKTNNYLELSWFAGLEVSLHPFAYKCELCFFDEEIELDQLTERFPAFCMQCGTVQTTQAHLVSAYRILFEIDWWTD